MTETRVVIPVDEQRVREIVREEILKQWRHHPAPLPNATYRCRQGAPRWACEQWCMCGGKSA